MNSISKIKIADGNIGMGAPAKNVTAIAITTTGIIMYASSPVIVSSGEFLEFVLYSLES